MSFTGGTPHALGTGDDAGNTTKRLSVLIADDHMLLAESVAAALAAPPRQFQSQIVSTFDDTIAALSSGTHFDLVLLDLKMPGMLGLKSVNTVIEAAKPTWVVLLSGNADRGIVQAAVENGARGLIPKTLSLKALISVVDLVLAGEIFLPAVETRNFIADDESGKEQLQEREVTVLKLASEGRTNKEIASAVGESEATIKMYMRIICRKLNTRNRAHAVVIGKERDLL